MLWFCRETKTTIDSCKRGNCRQQTSPPVHSLLPLCTTTKSNSVTQSACGIRWKCMTTWCPERPSRRYCQRQVSYGPLRENVTSSTKPEVHNVFHRRQRRTEPRPRTTRTENFVKFESVVFTHTTLASAGISCRRMSVCLSVRLSVCHKSVFYWNG